LSSVAPRLLSVDHLLLHGGRGPHTRCTGADAAKQRTVAYLSGRGRGNRCFCRHELMTIVTPLSRPGSAKTAASLCLYSVYRKQERSLFTAALASSGRVRPVVSHTQHSVGYHVPPHICFLTGAPQSRRPSRCPPFHVPIPPRRRPIVQWCPLGGGRR